MPLAYISYSHETDEVVARLVHDLRQSGIDVFYDKMLAPGESWERVLGNMLRRADYILVVLSPAYFRSRAIRELEIALQRELDEGVVRAIPVRAMDSELPSNLANKVYVDLRDEAIYESEMDKLLRTILENQGPIELVADGGTFAIQFALDVMTSSHVSQLAEFLASLEGFTRSLLAISDKEYAPRLIAQFSGGIPLQQIGYQSPLQIKIDLGVADLVNAVREIIKDFWYRNRVEKQQAALEVRAKEIEVAERLVDLVSRSDRELTRFQRNALATDVIPRMRAVQDQALLAYLQNMSGWQPEL